MESSKMSTDNIAKKTQMHINKSASHKQLLQEGEIGTTIYSTLLGKKKRHTWTTLFFAFTALI